MNDAGKITKQVHRDIYEVVRDFKGRRQLGSPGEINHTPRNYSKVKVRNLTGGNLPRGSVVEFDDFLLAELEQDYLWFEGKTPNAERIGWGVTLKPIPSTEIDEVLCIGVCIAFVKIVDESHEYAERESGETVLRSAATGPVKILHKPAGGTPPDERECVVQLMDEAAPAIGIPFRNDSGETVPAYAVMRITGSATVDGTEHLTIEKPSYTFQRKYLVNLGSEVANGDTGTGTWFDESKTQYVLYDEADGTPAGEEWGAWPGQWSLKKERLGFTLINGAAGRAIGVQREIVSLLGKFYDELEQGGSAEFKIWMRYDGQKRDTQMMVTAWDWYLNKEETIAKNTQGELAWYSSKWHVRNAYCSEDDTDDAAGGSLAEMGSDGSGFPQVFVSSSSSGGYVSPSTFQGFDL
jgi:hypothetical protein